MTRTMLFHRDFRGFTGGHFKVWNYFDHVEAASGWRARAYFTPGSLWDASNPWLDRQDEALPSWDPHSADALFLGGHDWRMIPPAERDHYPKPILNLIQHVHHADPAHPLSAFLGHRAVRVCVSAEVRDALAATGRVNGPICTIPNGIDLDALPVPGERTVDWLICGLKEGTSAVAKSLAKRLQSTGGWGRVETLTKLLARADFLAAMARAHRVVLLPRATEGFYLPALEAMALGCLVICPDCVGNRSFCRNGISAVIPDSGSEEDVLTSLERTRLLTPDQTSAIVANAAATATEHTLVRERAAFHELLATLPSLW